MRRISVILFKEWKESLRNKMILFGAIFLPLLMVGAAVAMVYQGRTSGPPGAEVALFNTALMYFLILPVIIPLAIAVYSIVGEKEQGSLEPLLATPISDWELFLGKALVSVLPAVVLTWGSFGLFLGVSVALLGRDPLPRPDRTLARCRLRPHPPPLPLQCGGDDARLVARHRCPRRLRVLQPRGPARARSAHHLLDSEDDREPGPRGRGRGRAARRKCGRTILRHQDVPARADPDALEVRKRLWRRPF